MDGYPPLAQETACSTVNENPQAHFDGSIFESCSTGPGHRERLVYSEQSHEL